MGQDIAVIDARRSAIGAFMGTLSGMEAHHIGAAVIADLLERTGVAPGDVDDVILGQVLTAGQGQNPARQAAIAAGLPDTTPAITINQVCGSGLRAVMMGAQAIANGDSTIVIAGGQENMSLSRHCLYARKGVKFGDQNLGDTMIIDGLWDAFGDIHMGITAENIARHFGIDRKAQDEFAAASQNKCEQAMQRNVFDDEITPVTLSSRKGDTVFDRDEYPRAGVSAESLAALKPAFQKDGTVTAGNASGLNDGAAAVMLMRVDEAEKRGLPVLGVIRSYAVAGVAPDVMGTGPVPASRKALERAGWGVDDLELVESNEAFAAQACYVMRELSLDPEIVNIYGGAIALGHPIGASGARVLVTLLHALGREGKTKGLATLCVGGGMGVAMCIERTS